MANQFSARIRFEAVAWRAIDPDTDTTILVVEDSRGASWTVKHTGPKGIVNEGGRANTPAQARAKARRACARIAKWLAS